MFVRGNGIRTAEQAMAKINNVTKMTISFEFLFYSCAFV